MVRLGTVFLAGLMWVGSVPARAEVVELLDGSRMSGTFVHYFDGVLTFKTSTGALVKIPSNRVRAIRFKLPKPRPVFSTPAKTFWRQRKLLLAGRIQDFVDCFSLQYQTLMMHQFGSMSMEDLAAMRQEVQRTKFRIKGTSYKGNMAFLTVVQSKGNMSVTAKIPFVKENGEWKMIPMGDMGAQRPEGATRKPEPRRRAKRRRR